MHTSKACHFGLGRRYRTICASLKTREHIATPPSSVLVPPPRVKGRILMSLLGSGRGMLIHVSLVTTLDSCGHRARRATYPSPASLTIQEPVKDVKGKKRAAPEPSSDDDTQAASSSNKRTRIYPLRSRVEPQTEMPKKSRYVNE